MGNLPQTNTDGVTVTDRTASGLQPDNSPAPGTVPGSSPTGSAGGDLLGSYPNPTVAAIHETGGPTKLTFGAISNNQVLKRSGSTIIGDTVIGAAIPSGDILANITGGAAVPIGNTQSAVLDFVFGNTQGDILYRGASLWAALAPGSKASFLQAQGAGANPIWGAPLSWFNVVAYGVVYNSSGAAGANDTAITAAITAMDAAGGGVLYFPPLGTCYVSARQSLSSANGWVLLGGGSANTRIQQITSNTGVLSVVQTTRTTNFQIHGITIGYEGSNDTNTAEAIKVENTYNATNNDSWNFVSTDTVIVGVSSAQKAFAIGFNLLNQQNIRIEGYSYSGRPTGQYGVGICFDKSGAGGSGLKCIGAFMSNCRTFSGDTGINVAYDMEGLHLVNSDLVGGNYGITFTGSTQMVQMSMHNCHMNCIVADTAAFSLVGCTISNASPAVVTATGHGLFNGYMVQLTTTGTLPSPLATQTDYFVVNKTANTFQLSATFGGAAINTTTAGSGTFYFQNYYQTGVWQTQIVGGLFYVGFIGANAKGIVGNFQDTTITNLTFNCNNTGCIEVDVCGLSNGVEVTGNRFQSPRFAAVGCRFGQSTSFCRCVENNAGELAGYKVSFQENGLNGNNTMGNTGGFQGAPALAGGVPSETFTLDVTPFNLGKAAGSITAPISGTFPRSNLVTAYDQTISTATTAHFVAWNSDGTNTSAGAIRLNVSVNP